MCVLWGSTEELKVAGFHHGSVYSGLLSSSFESGLNFAWVLFILMVGGMGASIFIGSVVCFSISTGGAFCISHFLLGALCALLFFVVLFLSLLECIVMYYVASEKRMKHDLIYL